jgi:hypothetical protein
MSDAEKITTGSGYVTEQEVIEAAKLLEKANGKRASAAVVRVALGNRGSNGTIQGHLNKWREDERTKLADDTILLDAAELKTLSAAFAALLKARLSTVTENYTNDLARTIESSKASAAAADVVNVQLQDSDNNNALLKQELAEKNNELVRLRETHTEFKAEARSELDAVRLQAENRRVDLALAELNLTNAQTEIKALKEQLIAAKLPLPLTSTEEVKTKHHQA